MTCSRCGKRMGKNLRCACPMWDPPTKKELDMIRRIARYRAGGERTVFPDMNRRAQRGESR